MLRFASGRGIAELAILLTGAGLPGKVMIPSGKTESPEGWMIQTWKADVFTGRHCLFFDLAAEWSHAPARGRVRARESDGADLPDSDQHNTKGAG